MNDISPEIRNLLLQYDGDTRAILRDHPKLEYLYALSDMRENVLEWFDFDENSSLLQVGSDYGALTGLYARRVRSVTVLDENRNNLDLNHLRHKEHDNIRFVQGGIEDFWGEEGGAHFDYVVMVGALKKPYEQQIAKAKSLLKPGGKLILAVCNRLGLKYKVGAIPDETSLLKSELENLLRGDGERPSGKLEFYYPMPDYRMTTTLYSEKYLPAKGDLSHAVLAYDYPVYLRFDLGKMYDEICEEKQFETFANSYLAIWSGHEKK